MDEGNLILFVYIKFYKGFRKRGFIMGSWRMRRITPAQIIILGFLFIILSGAVLLMLPISSKDGTFTPFLDCLFTATSATCVTGLVVFDTYTHWSFFGQSVILLLIQIGGLGVITTALAIALFTKRKIGFRERFVMQESISAPQVSGIVRLTSFILKATFVLELLGAIVLAIQFLPEYGFRKGLWFSIFHSVSAFCNAGFDLMGHRGEYSSLVSYVGNPLVTGTIMFLIVAGGLGFFVWKDIKEKKWRVHTYRLQTKIVVLTTFLLLLLPAIYFFFYEFNQPQWADLSTKERILASMFQSVTPRTAGFNSVDYAAMQSSSILISICLMLIGGSPGSTAGGFKTTTLAMLVLCIRSVIQKKESIQGFGRRIPPEVLRSGVSIFTLYLVLFLTGGTIISCIDGVSLSSALFESASAIGTVGLTVGITRDLSDISHIILILLMYFGRVGGLTMIYAVTAGHMPSPAQLPQEKITVG